MRDLQFYLSQKITTQKLLYILSRLVGFEVESLECLSEKALGFLSVSEYNSGFLLGINLAWHPSVNPQKSQWEIARDLARELKIYVATDLPDRDSDVRDPYYWCVAEPNGKIFKRKECLTNLAEEEAGLIFEETYKEEIDFKSLSI
ncbi:hypothetical protein [Baaleninema sp.]|uniref:hypothetical protein n=1 Tax=Baaleninema sp. TaxID=3101197 RepID=UPI003CFF2F27